MDCKHNVADSGEFVILWQWEGHILNFSKYHSHLYQMVEHHLVLSYMPTRQNSLLLGQRKDILSLFDVPNSQLRYEMEQA